MASDTYTHGHDASVLRSHRWRTVENSARYVIPHLRSGQRILDVGCGPGTITLDLAARVGAGGSVLGVDRSDEVLSQVRAEAADRDDAAEVAFRVGDAYDLGLPDQSFDVVHAHQVLQHLSDPVAALVEMLRVVRPDGVVAVRDADYDAMTWYPGDARLDHWLDVYRQVARRNKAEPDAGRHLKAWARAAGAAQVDATADCWLFTSPTDRRWWGSLWADRVIDSEFGRQAVDYDLATPADLIDWAKAWRTWSEDEDGWFVVLHGEVIARPTQA